MSIAIEQETDDIALAETAPVIEGNGVPDAAAKDAAVKAVNSQAEVSRKNTERWKFAKEEDRPGEGRQSESSWVKLGRGDCE